jgi:hypothetical protein
MRACSLKPKWVFSQLEQTLFSFGHRARYKNARNQIVPVCKRWLWTKSGDGRAGIINANSDRNLVLPSQLSSATSAPFVDQF